MGPDINEAASCGEGGCGEEVAAGWSGRDHGLRPDAGARSDEPRGRVAAGARRRTDARGSGAELKDGTKLLTPPGSRFRPGLLNEGMLIVAMYREENGDKILTRISLGQSEPAPGAPEGSPKKSPEDPPKRY